MRKLYLLTTSLLCLFFSANSQDTASFTFTIGTNNQVNFVNKSVLHGDALRKAHWSFGDGTRQVTPPLANVFHQYNAGGSYTVCLRIYKYSNTTHDSAITAEFCKKIELPNTTRPDSCKASFTNLGTNSGILTQLFIAQPGHNHDKRPEQICWSFGDGKDTCISYNPALASNYALYHTYEKPGVYKVCVKIRYQGGCVADYCREIKVGHEEECKIDFKTEPVSASPFTRHFIAYPAHSQQKKPVKICWDFGDGTTECKQFATTNTDPYAIRHTYAKPGKYNVCVSVLFDGGCEAKICKTIAIETPPPPPPADTCFVKIVEVATNAHNLERIFHADIRPDRRLEKICWIFGDGQDTCINLPNPTTTPQQPLSIKHRFPAPGVYRVCVKVKYVGGCETHNCQKFGFNGSNNANNVNGDALKAEGGDMKAPATSGLYLIIVNFATSSWTVTPYTGPSNLYIVGDATPGGWNNPVPVPSQEFTQSTTGIFTLTLPLTADKSFLFLPVNGDWGQKFGYIGANNTNNVMGDKIKADGGDMKAPATSGSYTITVNFMNMTYKVQ